MASLKNIIFDLGGVIIDLNFSLTAEAFRALGIHNIDEIYQWLIENETFEQVETGHMSPEEFHEVINNMIDEPLSPAIINEAWNAILLQIPEDRMKILFDLKEEYNLYLLSNTNQVHIDWINNYVRNEFDMISIEDPFKKVYYSHNMGVRKPSKEIFEKVLLDAGLKAEETLFIDDTEENVITASKLGMRTEWIIPGKAMEDLFEYS